MDYIRAVLEYSAIRPDHSFLHEGGRVEYTSVSYHESLLAFFFFFNDTAPTEIYPFSLPDALPIYAPHRPPAPRAAAVRGRRRVYRRHVLRLGDAVRAGESLPPSCVHAARRERAEPAAPEPGDGVPPADALPRLYLDHYSVRVRDRGAALETPRRGLAGRDPQMDAALLAVPLDRDLPWNVVGVRRAWVGRLLGLGPRRECVALAVAYDDGLPTLGDDPGEARDAQEVEPRAHHRVVAALDLRDVHHALGRHLERALVHPIERRVLLSLLPDRRGDGELRRVRQSAAAARGRGEARVDGEPRGELSVQQPLVRGHRILRAVGHALPDPLRARPGDEGHGRATVRSEERRVGKECRSRW